MSRIDDLIADLCPNGVPFRPLSDCVGYEQPGRFLVQSTNYDNQFSTPVLTAGRTFILGYTDETDGIYPASTDSPVIIFDDFTTASKWVDFPFKAKSSAMKILTIKNRTDASLRYIWHAMQSIHYSPQDHTRQWIGTFGNIRIPVPPPEVQNEIVAILDRLAYLNTELDGLLNREISLRLAQFRHYLPEVLSDGSSLATTVKLRDVVDLQIGFAFKSSQFSQNDEDERLLRGDNIGQGFLHGRAFKRWRRSPSDGLNAFELQKDDIVLAMDRPVVSSGLKWARLGVADLPALLVQRVARLRGKAEVINQEYLATVISSPAFTDHILLRQSGNTVPHINGSDIGDFEVSLPPVVAQERIAANAARFGDSAAALPGALLEETSARRKQYEYYREKLLNFEEASA